MDSSDSSKKNFDLFSRAFPTSDSIDGSLNSINSNTIGLSRRQSLIQASNAKRSATFDSGNLTMPVLNQPFKLDKVPHRSILKSAMGDDNHTITGVLNIPGSDDTFYRSKLAKRRVSFAPEATVRRLIDHVHKDLLGDIVRRTWDPVMTNKPRLVEHSGWDNRLETTTQETPVNPSLQDSDTSTDDENGIYPLTGDGIDSDSDNDNNQKMEDTTDLLDQEVMFSDFPASNSKFTPSQALMGEFSRFQEDNVSNEIHNITFKGLSSWQNQSDQIFSVKEQKSESNKIVNTFSTDAIDFENVSNMDFLPAVNSKLTADVASEIQEEATAAINEKKEKQREILDNYEIDSRKLENKSTQESALSEKEDNEEMVREMDLCLTKHLPSTMENMNSDSFTAPMDLTQSTVPMAINKLDNEDFENHTAPMDLTHIGDMTQEASSQENQEHTMEFTKIGIFDDINAIDANKENQIEILTDFNIISKNSFREGENGSNNDDNNEVSCSNDNDNDPELTMEFTVLGNEGINVPPESDNDSIDINEPEQTMDFTIGEDKDQGMVKRTVDQNAKVCNLSDNDIEENDELTMELTVVGGSKINISSANGNDDRNDHFEETMDFTENLNLDPIDNNHKGEDELTMDFTFIKDPKIDTPVNQENEYETELSMDITMAFGSKTPAIYEFREIIGRNITQNSTTTANDIQRNEVARPFDNLQLIEEQNENEKNKLSMDRARTDIIDGYRDTHNNTDSDSGKIKRKPTSDPTIDNSPEVDDDLSIDMDFSQVGEEDVYANFGDRDITGMVVAPETLASYREKNSDKRRRISQSPDNRSQKALPLNMFHRFTPPKDYSQTFILRSPAKSPYLRSSAQLIPDTHVTPKKGSYRIEAMSVPSESSSFTPLRSVAPKITATPRSIARHREMLMLNGSPVKQRLDFKLKGAGVPYQGFNGNTLGFGDRANNDQDSEGNEDYEPITLGAFLKLIDIEFYDDGISSNGSKLSFSSLDDTSNEVSLEATSTDYSVAMCKLPVLELYGFACKELIKDIQSAKEVFARFESETVEDNPDLFKEYLESPTDVRMDMIINFKLLKKWARSQAFSGWYNWRFQLTNGAIKAIKKVLVQLDEDENNISKMKSEVETNWSDLEESWASTNRSIIEDEGLLERLESNGLSELKRLKEDLAKAEELLVAKDLKLKNTEESISDLEKNISINEGIIEEAEEAIKKAEQLRDKNREFDISEIRSFADQFRYTQKISGFDVLSVKGTHIHLVMDKFVNISLDASNFIDDISFELVHDSSRNLRDYCLSIFIKNLADYLKQEYSNQSRSTILISDFLERIMSIWIKIKDFNLQLHSLQLHYLIRFPKIIEAKEETFNFTAILLSGEESNPVKLSLIISTSLRDVLLQPLEPFMIEPTLRYGNSVIEQKVLANLSNLQQENRGNITLIVKELASIL